MEIFFTKFSHLTEKVFDQLDDKSLVNCRIVNKSWQNYLENQKLLQIRIIKATISQFHEVGPSWTRVFEKATTKTITDLGKAVGEFYQKDSNLTYYKGLTPLHITAGIGNLQLLLNIYKKAITKCPKDENDMIPLHYSAQNGHFEVCKFIMRNLSDKNPGDKDGWTPLHSAAMNDHLKICQYIMGKIENKNPGKNN